MTAEQNADATEAKESGPPEAETPDSGAADKDTAEESTDLATQLSERTADLQRITAEYHNYRKRVERDKSLAAEQTTATVVAGLLPVLDDIDRAREHGDLEGPFATVSEQLLNALIKLGLEVFGEKGDPFDPAVHEAVAHMVSPEVTETSCIDVMRRGYRLGERLLRPAMVAVAEPAEAETAETGKTEAVAEDAELSAETEEAVEAETEAKAEAEAEAAVEAEVEVEELAETKDEDATPNLDADVPSDEEQVKAEQVEDAVAEAAESDAEAGSEAVDEEKPESEKDKSAPDDTKKTENE
ncbi:GrpE protein [Stackebrandtia nassauensis DSM 44728]|uniref:Protein GrpE n=1 Tax=Stackebrandtia nassauensis (strain DSM 44728 / CIP 108903 / NRRL B-16338 / NBRC 102104 / LLR-40K-21) TaxID=446470 RepID=D3Q4C2_STANL|nr:nucleotide exchange factor GrpE [Stackebrandtia nassauensis]ADD40082.1 GrpE protein [Stackebrandtia nassauensis DSM 44728]